MLFGCAEGTFAAPVAECDSASATCGLASAGSGTGGSGGAAGVTVIGGSTAGHKTVGSPIVAGAPSAGGTDSGGSAGSVANLAGQAGAGTGGSAGATGGMAGSAAGGSAPSAPKDLTAGKQASADSEESGNAAERGNDGDLGTRWCAADAELDHYWTVDLGEQHDLSGLEITFEFAGRDYGYVVEGSLDDDDYATLLDRADNAKQTQVQNESLSGTARYVRVRFVALPLDTWASFFELKVLGT